MNTVPKNIIDAVVSQANASTCDRAYVGAAYFNVKGKILGIGCNNRPVTSYISKTCGKHGHVLNDSGGCIATIHAEISAIIDANSIGNLVNDQYIYVTHEPCYQCAKVLIQLNLQRVFYTFSYKSKSSNGSGLKLLEEYCIPVVQIHHL